MVTLLCYFLDRMFYALKPQPYGFPASGTHSQPANQCKVLSADQWSLLRREADSEQSLMGELQQLAMKYLPDDELSRVDRDRQRWRQDEATGYQRHR